MKRIKFLFKMAKKRARTFLLVCSLVIAVVIGLSLFGIFALKREWEEININAQSNIERLKSLGYVAWTEVSEENKNKIGVTLYEPDKSYKGINVYSNHFGARKIIFMDMQGKIIHTFDIKEPHRYFDILKPYQQGFLLLVQPKLLKLNRKGEVEWKDKKGKGFHHDFWIADNDDIYALIHRPISELRYYDRIIRFKDQALIILDSKRKVKKILPFSKLFKKELFSERSRILIQKQLDRNKKFITFHANTVEVINRNIGVAEEGDVLLSLCDLNLIAIVDVEKEEVIWSWGQGELEKQHHPSVLDNGNILIFDNGSYRKYSRVVELDPVTKKIVWEYKADPPESFYSFGRGGVYALPNGNVLITESDKGHVFEVTRKGEKVWEFWNSSIKPKKDYVATTMKATIYRMQRFSPDILDRLH